MPRVATTARQHVQKESELVDTAQLGDCLAQPSGRATDGRQLPSPPKFVSWRKFQASSSLALFLAPCQSSNANVHFTNSCLLADGFCYTRSYPGRYNAGSPLATPQLDFSDQKKMSFRGGGGGGFRGGRGGGGFGGSRGGAHTFLLALEDKEQVMADI